LFSRPQIPALRSPPNGTPKSLLPSTITVKSKAANPRDASGTHGKVLATLSAGTKLSVHGDEKDWVLVNAENGKEGWIAKSLTTLKAE
jgi:uncharacterized protein YgiM (DUF1202 family)